MQPVPNRSELDHLARFHSLDEPSIETLLALAQARPSRAEGRQFLAQCLRIGGLLSLAAGVVFLIAANWSEVAVFGRFALLEAVLVACAGLALWKPPPAFVGRGALFLAFITTGALLALFGQTYQTGADVYELFLTWTLLGAALAWVAQWSVATAAWVLVLNLALLLYCGWQPGGGLFWVLLGRARFQTADLVVGAAWLNLLLWFAAEWRRPQAAPDWVRRLLVSCAFLFATWAGVLAALQGEVYHADGAGAQRASSLATALYFAAIAATIGFTLRRREDIYPLALVLGSFIGVSLVWIGRTIDSTDEGVFLLLALYLIAVSTVGGRVLLGLHRRWREAGGA